MTNPETETEFETEELEIESFAQKGGKGRAPRARRYIIRIDKQKYTVPVPMMTGREILTLAGKVPPEDYKLTQKHHGGAATTVGLDDTVDFRAPGVERFMTLKRDQTDGDGDVRRQFALPEYDVRYLESTGLRWETLVDASGTRWLLLHDRPLPELGYNVSRAQLALRIVPGYPDAQIDMAYLHPPLARGDGKPIAAVSNLEIDGRTFQQWSRHRTGAAPWRPGEDDVATHLVLVDDWLERELAKP